MDDVRTLLYDSGLSHSFWAEAAAYSVDMRNLVPSHRHPNAVPLELFTGKRQNISHLRVFGSKCWAKISTVNGAQINGGSKLDNRSVECLLLGYATGSGNYKVQDVASRHMFVSRDVIFEEGHPHRTSPNMGETIQLFDMLNNTLDNNETTGDHTTDKHQPSMSGSPSLDVNHPPSPAGQIPAPVTLKPRHSSRIPQPSHAILESRDYQQ